VGLSVSDLDVAMDWYEKVLGFGRGYRFEEPRAGLRGVFVIAPGGGSVELLERAGSESGIRYADPFQAAGMHGYHHICLAVDDIDEVHERLVAAGATEVWQPRRSPQPGVRNSYLADLDGNFIELFGGPAVK
jgi:catechol 2,3-dioxygenase-like lactoylglutathione lyase family enzyme